MQPTFWSTGSSLTEGNEECAAFRVRDAERLRILEDVQPLMTKDTERSGQLEVWSGYD